MNYRAEYMGKEGERQDLMEEPMRLSKMLAKAGVASRRGAEALIKEGKVTVNGKRVTDPATRVNPWEDKVRVFGRRVFWNFSPLYILMNKPRGVVTTLKDPQGRPTVRDLLKHIHRRVFPVGRLDYDTEGVLLLTNDGELAQRLMHPRFGVERTYEVKVKGIPTPETLQRMRQGTSLDKGQVTKAKVRLLRTLKANSWLEVTLTQGRYREVRRMCEAVGHPVLALKRTKFGPLTVKGLPVGSYRPLTPLEIRRLKAWAYRSPKDHGEREGKKNRRGEESGWMS